MHPGSFYLTFPINLFHFHFSGRKKQRANLHCQKILHFKNISFPEVFFNFVQLVFTIFTFSKSHIEKIYTLPFVSKNLIFLFLIIFLVDEVPYFSFHEVIVRFLWIIAHGKVLALESGTTR